MSVFAMTTQELLISGSGVRTNGQFTDIEKMAQEIQAFECDHLISNQTVSLLAAVDRDATASVFPDSGVNLIF
jgi:hypothetical protein